MATPPFDQEEYEAMLRAQEAEASVEASMQDSDIPEGFYDDFINEETPTVDNEAMAQEPQATQQEAINEQTPVDFTDALSKAINDSVANSSYIKQFDSQYTGNGVNASLSINNMIGDLEAMKAEGLRDSMRMALAYEALGEYEGVAYRQQGMDTFQDTDDFLRVRQEERVFNTLGAFGGQEGVTLPPKELLYAPTFQRSSAINSNQYNVLKSSIDSLPAHIKIAVLDEIGVVQSNYENGNIPFNEAYVVAVGVVDDFEAGYNSTKPEIVRPVSVSQDFIEGMNGRAETLGVPTPSLDTKINLPSDANARVTLFDMPQDFISKTIESEVANSKYLRDGGIQFAGQRLEPIDDMKRVSEYLQSHKATDGIKDSMRVAIAYEMLSDYERVAYIQQNPSDDPENAEIFTNAIKGSRLLATLQHAESSNPAGTDLPSVDLMANSPLRESSVMTAEQLAVLQDTISSTSHNISLAILDELDSTQRQMPSGSLSFDEAYQIATHTAKEFETNYNNVRLNDMTPSRGLQDFLDNIQNKASIENVQLPDFENRSLNAVRQEVLSNAKAKQPTDIISYGSLKTTEASALIANFGDGSSSAAGISRDDAVSDIQQSIQRAEALKSEGLKDSMRLALNYAARAEYEEISLTEVSDNPAPLSHYEIKDELRRLDANSVGGIYNIASANDDPSLSGHNLPPEHILTEHPYGANSNISDKEKALLRESLDALNPSLRLAVLDEIADTQKLKPSGELDFSETLHVAVKTVENFDNRFNNIKTNNLAPSNVSTDFRAYLDDVAIKANIDLPLIDNQTLEDYKKTVTENKQASNENAPQTDGIEETPDTNVEPENDVADTPENKPSGGQENISANEAPDNTEEAKEAQVEGVSEEMLSEVALFKELLSNQDYYKDNPNDLASLESRLDEVGKALDDVDVPNSIKIAVMNHDVNTMAHEQVFENSLKLKDEKGGTFHSHFTPMTKEKSKAISDASREQYSRSKFAEPYVSSATDILDKLDLSKAEAKIIDNALRRTSLGARLHAYEEIKKEFIDKDASDGGLEPNFENVSSIIGRSMSEIDAVHSHTSPQYKRSKSALDSYRSDVFYSVNNMNKGKTKNVVDEPNWLNSISSDDIRLEDITNPTNLKSNDSSETLQNEADDELDNTASNDNISNEVSNNNPENNASANKASNKPKQTQSGKTTTQESSNKASNENEGDKPKPKSSSKDKSNSDSEENDDKKPKKKRENEKDKDEVKEDASVKYINQGYNFTLFGGRGETKKVVKHVQPEPQQAEKKDGIFSKLFKKTFKFNSESANNVAGGATPSGAQPFNATPFNPAHSFNSGANANSNPIEDAIFRDVTERQKQSANQGLGVKQVNPNQNQQPRNPNQPNQPPQGQPLGQPNPSQPQFGEGAGANNTSGMLSHSQGDRKKKAMSSQDASDDGRPKKGLVDLKDDFLNDSLSGLQNQHSKLMDAYEKKKFPDEYLYNKTEEFLKNADQFANSVESNSRVNSSDQEQQERLLKGMRDVHEFKGEIEDQAKKAGFFDENHPVNKEKKKKGENLLKDTFNKSKQVFQNIGSSIMSFVNSVSKVIGALRGKK